jgi:hypothetical protein
MSDNGEILSTKRSLSTAEEARYWRKRAAEVRKVGEIFSDQETRAKLNEIASHYDQMADEVEASRRGQLASTVGHASPRS